MIRNSEIGKTTFAGGFCHLLESIDAIGCVSVCVQDAADVLVSDQLRQAIVSCQRDFPRPSRNSGSMNARPSAS